MATLTIVIQLYINSLMYLTILLNTSDYFGTVNTLPTSGAWALQFAIYPKFLKYFYIIYHTTCNFSKRRMVVIKLSYQNLF